ncbi:hypothetical protein BVI2075_230061 [Burkholderia vietnamiensis]|nr:hypothetical protein BVI2075_230061 [Burkholderia vietnamiensis]
MWRSRSVHRGRAVFSNVGQVWTWPLFRPGANWVSKWVINWVTIDFSYEPDRIQDVRAVGAGRNAAGW